MRHFLVAVVVLLAALGCATVGRAETLNATPADVRAVIAKAQPGDVIALSGKFGQVAVNGKVGLTLDFAGAVIRPTTAEGGLIVDGGSDITVRNFTIRSDGKKKGAVFRNVSGLTVETGYIDNPQKGLVLQNVHGFRVSGVAVIGSTGDGFGVSGSSDGVLSYNLCAGVGVAIVHPDCIQLSSGIGPVRNVRIEYNVNYGDSMGFTEHGCASGACTGNSFTGNNSTGRLIIGLQAGPDAILRDNVVRSIPGGRGSKINAPLSERCGNTVVTLKGVVISDPECK